MFTAVKMLLVFGLLGGTLWFLRRHDRSSLVTARRAERPVAVLAQAKVGKTASVALVRIGGDAYAVGVTEQNVTLLVPEPVVLPDPDAEAETAAPTGRPAPPTVTDALRAALGRRPRVQYLDVVLPQQGDPHQNSSASGTEGSGSSPTARMPEPARRR
jgi:flagellar biogenesis protein FliO